MAGSSLMLDHLRAAQAEAQRFHGAGPVLAWQPRRPRWWLPTAAAVATALAALLLVRPAVDPAPIAVAEGRRDATLAPAPLPPAAITAAAPPGAAAPTLPPVTPVSLPYGAAAAAPEAPLTDRDDWALHPEPVPAPELANLQRPLFNTPVLPDEAAPLRDDELPAADDSGGGAGDEVQAG